MAQLLEELPADLWRRLLVFGGVKEVLLCGLVCWGWHTVSSDDLTWELLLARFENRVVPEQAAPRAFGGSRSVCQRRGLLDQPARGEGAGRRRKLVARSPEAEVSRERTLELCRKVCSWCGFKNDEEPDRCGRCGRRWGRPAAADGAKELRTLQVWRRALLPLKSSLPDEVSLGRARLCFSSELHGGSLRELMISASQTAARFFLPSERGCFTLLALRTLDGVVGVLTDFPWRSLPVAPGGKGFGSASSDCVLFKIVDGKVSAYRPRRGSSAIMRYTGDFLEVGPATAERGEEPALRVDAALGGLRSCPSQVFGSPALLVCQEASISAALCLSWAFLEGEAIEEQELLALQENQNTFMLNFIGSSVRSQIAAKAGSSWS